MMKAFLNTLTELARRDPRILFLTGDLGYDVIEPFAETYPERYFNVGVAEQNMVGIATGMAEAGFLPFVYSITTFATLRPYEFIRNGPILHRLPVRIIAVGGGVEYAHAGITHYGLEDIAVMRVQPAIRIIAPADADQTRSALEATWDMPGPVYYRIGKDEETLVAGLEGRFELQRVQFIGSGSDLLIVTMGSIANEAVNASEVLQQQGVSTTVAVISSMNPAPVEDLAQALAQFPLAISLEAHYIQGGVGSLICEIVAERGIPCRVLRRGFETMPSGRSGSQRYLYEENRLTGRSIADTAIKALKG